MEQQVVKLTGAEWHAFMDDKAEWPDGAWFQDEGFSVNGADWPEGWDGEVLDPSDRVELCGGEFYPSASDREFFSLEAKLRKWLKARKVTVMVIEVENEYADLQRAAISQLLGTRVLK